MLIGAAFNDRGGGQDSASAAIFALGLLGVVASLPFIGSAWYGYAKTSRCRDLNRSSPVTLRGAVPGAP